MESLRELVTGLFVLLGVGVVVFFGLGVLTGWFIWG